MEQDRNLAQKVLDWLRNFIDKLRKAFEVVSYEHREAALLMQKGTLKYLEGLQELWDQALMGTVEGNTTGMDGSKFQARALNDPQLRKDAQKVTDADVKALLQMCKSNTARNDKSIDGTYIPLRKDTPAYMLKMVGANEAPMIMQVLKARQAMAPEGMKFGSSHGHAMTPDEMILCLKEIDAPEYVGISEKTNRVSVIVTSAKDNRAVVTYFDFGQNKNPEALNGYVGGKFNVIVTMFKRADVEDAIEYLERSGFIEKTPGEEASASHVPALSKREFPDTIISTEDTKSKRKFSFRSTERDTAYQLRDGDTISSREALANALQSTAQNDRERELLAQYKGIIKELDEDEAKLAKHKGIIRDLSFKKGGLTAQEKEELDKAKNRAQIVQNRLNRNDKKLLELESTKALKAVVEREKAKAEKRIREQKKEELARYRERTKDTQSRAHMRDRIKDEVKKLNKLLTQETDTKYVPEELWGSGTWSLPSSIHYPNTYAKRLPPLSATGGVYSLSQLQGQKARSGASLSGSKPMIT